MANYKVIGVDQKEYGPVAEEQLHQWIVDGRVNAQTRVQAEGATGWKTLSELPEFGGAFQVSTPPPLPAGTAGIPARTSGLAITSLVLGILGMVTCGITVLLSAPVGLILGIVAMNRIGTSSGKPFSNVRPPTLPAATITPSTPNSTVWTKAKLIRRP